MRTVHPCRTNRRSDRLQNPFVPGDLLIRGHPIHIQSTPQLNPGAALHRRADKQLIQTALESRPHIRRRHLAGSHHRVGVPQLPSRTLPIRRRVEPALNRRVQRRPQVHHQLVRVEPQRRLYIPLARLCRLRRAVRLWLGASAALRSGFGAGPLSAEYVDIKPPKSLASITLDPYRENRTDPEKVCRSGGRPPPVGG